MSRKEHHVVQEDGMLNDLGQIEYQFTQRQKKRQLSKVEE